MTTAQHNLTLRPKNGRNAVYTSQPIPAGGVIIPVRGQLLSAPNKYSLQIDASTHIGAGGLLNDELLHSCSANAFVDFSGRPEIVIRSFRPIAANEEVTINYCASEERIVDTFTCDCGSPNCYGQIRGFAFLDPDQQKQLYDQLSPYLISTQRE